MNRSRWKIRLAQMAAGALVASACGTSLPRNGGNESEQPAITVASCIVSDAGLEVRFRADDPLSAEVRWRLAGFIPSLELSNGDLVEATHFESTNSDETEFVVGFPTFGQGGATPEELSLGDATYEIAGLAEVSAPDLDALVGTQAGAVGGQVSIEGIREVEGTLQIALLSQGPTTGDLSLLGPLTATLKLAGREVAVGNSVGVQRLDRGVASALELELSEPITDRHDAVLRLEGFALGLDRDLAAAVDCE